MGNKTSVNLLAFHVKFSREIPNDFYLSGDRVQGIVHIATNSHEDNINLKYGPLHVRLIGELNGLGSEVHDQLGLIPVQVFFEKEAQVIELPDDHQQSKISRLQNFRWAFDGQLDSVLPSSLPRDRNYRSCIYYYAYLYFPKCPKLSKTVRFTVFTRTPSSIIIQNPFNNNTTEVSSRHKSLTFNVQLLNNGLIVPGENFILQIEIINPLRLKIKSMRVTLEQYRYIVDIDTNFVIFHTNLPRFKQEICNSQHLQGTYVTEIPLEKCQFFAPTSFYKKVRYELIVQCYYIQYITENSFTVKLPVICSTDHQKPLVLADELRSLPGFLQDQLNESEEVSPPSYEDVIAGVI